MPLGLRCRWGFGRCSVLSWFAHLCSKGLRADSEESFNMHPEARRMAGHMGVRLCACTKDEKSRKVAEILRFFLVHAPIRIGRLYQ